MRSRTQLALLLLTSAACAGGGQAQDLPAPAGAVTDDMNPTLLPSGFGSLGQDEVSILMRLEEVEVRFMPLDRRVLPLLAPDAEMALRSLIRQQQRAIDSIAGFRGVSDPALALVSFYGRRPAARFDAQLLDVRYRGRVLRPLGIVPLDPLFGSQELGVRGTARGIYVFEEPLPVIEPMVLAYDGSESNDWSDKLQRLERERTRVRVRAAAADSTRGP